MVSAIASMVSRRLGYIGMQLVCMDLQTAGYSHSQAVSTNHCVTAQPKEPTTRVDVRVSQ